MLSYKNSTKVIKDSQTVTAILSVGATEQFGPYLPMHLDTLIAEHQAAVFGERLNAYVLPTLPFNTSEEHANQIGTVTVSPTVISMMLEEIIVNLSSARVHSIHPLQRARRGILGIGIRQTDQF